MSSNINLNYLVNLKAYKTSSRVEFLTFLSFAAIAFFVPLILPASQLVVGSIVNFMLVMAAINIAGWKKIIPLIILPSVASAFLGYLFGDITMFLIYLVPFIWVGNSILLIAFKFFYVAKKENYFSVLLRAAFLKALFLFIAAVILINFSVIPSALLAAMSIFQLATALIGGLLAYAANIAYRRYFKGSAVN